MSHKNTGLYGIIQTVQSAKTEDENTRQRTEYREGAVWVEEKDACQEKDPDYPGLCAGPADCGCLDPDGSGMQPLLRQTL